MGDFFKAGEQYRNRIGEYQVVEVTTPTLTIRYNDTGRLQEVEEELQERIVRNILREEALANQPEEERKSRSSSSSNRKKRAKFEGFTDGDFLGKIAGTSWRSKTSLGGLLAETLAERAGEPFESWAPNRQTSVFIAQPDDASRENLHDSAQFFVTTTDTDMMYGLMVQRPADAAEGTTAWDRLISVLGDDESAASKLNELLTGGHVDLNWYGETWGPAERETVRGDDEGLVMDRGAVTEHDSIEGVIERLNEAPQDQALILTIESTMPQKQAIAAGAAVADPVVELWVQLMDLYRACTG